MNNALNFRALALTSLLLASAACGSAPSSGGNSVPAPAAGGGAAVKPAGAAVISATDKPLDVITKAMRLQLDAKSYRAHINQTASNNTKSVMLVEYVAPDRYRVVRDAGGGGGGGPKLEFVIVGKDTYMKAGDGPWTKSPVNMGGMISSFKDPKMIEELNKGAEIKFIGPDTLDGAPMLVYQYTLDNVGGLAGKTVTKTWVAVADGLPRKSESEGEFQGIKSNTVFTMSDYNTDIRIEPPAKGGEGDLSARP